MATNTIHRFKTHASRDAVWMSNGRLVSHTISEPVIARSIEAHLAELLKDPVRLRKFLIEKKFLTPTGRLPKRHGG